MRIKQLLTNNNYPMSVIDNAVKKFLDTKQVPAIEANVHRDSINLYYQNQMTSSYKLVEKHLQKIIRKHVTPTDEIYRLTFKYLINVRK